MLQTEAVVETATPAAGQVEDKETPVEKKVIRLKYDMRAIWLGCCISLCVYCVSLAP